LHVVSPVPNFSKNAKEPEKEYDKIEEWKRETYQVK
jgi:hypothetical protein